MRISTPSLRTGRRWHGSRPFSQDVGRADQGRRPSPPHRREDVHRQIPHSPHHLCGGGRRHGAGGPARFTECEQARRPAEAHLLPFLMRAMVKAISEQPQLHALYDDEAGIVHQHAGIHIGIATQTGSGLVVPVVRHAEARDLWGCAAELNRLAEAARPARRRARSSAARPSPSRRSAPWAASPRPR